LKGFLTATVIICEDVGIEFEPEVVESDEVCSSTAEHVIHFCPDLSVQYRGFEVVSPPSISILLSSLKRHLSVLCVEVLHLVHRLELHDEEFHEEPFPLKSLPFPFPLPLSLPFHQTASTSICEVVIVELEGILDEAGLKVLIAL
jgi:hypothetical protein